MKYSLCAAIALISTITIHPDVVTVTATQDTTLHEGFPDNNLGGLPNMTAGRTGGFGRVRSLIRFDLTGKIPAGATITDVSVNVNLDKKPLSGAGSTFELHRMLQPWNEGAQVGDSRNTGDIALDGEVSWNRRSSPGISWQAPGASGANDSSATISSSVAMDLIGDYVFPSSATLISDVQGWVANPASNFGWMLKSANETTAQTARSFTTSEAGASLAPELQITYTAPVATELKIETVQVTGGNADLTWTGGRPPYRVQRATNILGPWEYVTPPATELQASAPLIAGSLNFFRVAGEVP